MRRSFRGVPPGLIMRQCRMRRAPQFLRRTSALAPRRQISEFSSLRPDSTAQSEDRTALLDSMTDDFVALVSRLMDAGFSLLNIVEFLREQSDMMEQMAGVVGSLLVGEGKQPRSHSACIIPPGIQRFVGRQAARCRCRVG